MESNVKLLKLKPELANMSFGELQKLQEKLGTKLYSATIFEGTTPKEPHVNYKRKNKNRPRMMSSKVRPPMLRDSIGVVKNEPRDPRFDSLCGVFDKHKFRTRYKFIDTIRDEEVKKLKNELKNVKDDPKRTKKLKFLILRMENQKREALKIQEEENARLLERQSQVQELRQGGVPIYKKKSERKMENLMTKYEELKNTGKLKKHIKRQRKKMVSKDRKKLSNLDL